MDISPEILTASIAAIVAGIISLGWWVYRLQVKIREDLSQEFNDQKACLSQAVNEANAVPKAFLKHWRMPAWYKALEGNRLVMRYISPAYSARFNVQPAQYIGKTDAEMWPKEIADAFAANDQLVIDKCVEVQCIETVPRSIGRMGDQGTDDWIVIKFPVIDEYSNRIRGVAGFCVKTDATQRAINNPGLIMIPRSKDDCTK